MTTEDANKASYLRLLAASNTRDADVIASTIDEVFDPDVTSGTPLPAADVTGAEAIKEVYRRLHDAYPDLQISAEDVLAEGDRVVSRQRVTGTHRGEYMGIPATGRSISWNEIFIFRFADGRIVEGWGVVDVAAQLRQLGLLPGRSSLNARC
ncbi:ester cyclase [Jiangella muralis]|uniref:ester cyclase n=1 Tax=Jiangella muralis TaxID=702383 RepID=UPI00196A033C|nr:ester cyclase [Jiangella muralis]